MIALLSLIAAGSAAAFFLYVSILQIAVIAGGMLGVVCAAGLALATGRLGRWVEIDEDSSLEAHRVRQ
jgi:hypothetical protein